MITSTMNRLDHPHHTFTRKNIEDVNKVEMTEEWKIQVKKFLNDLHSSYLLDKRIYADETFLCAGEATRAGRSESISCASAIITARKSYFLGSCCYKCK